ncbi:M16 family metallopeptidase [Nocardiopsis changdeensis]|uniref:Insulinase family protein n=1 Tax=Nocardiopsis changdeensis TaxID=2831969 RepID=A0ABX8BQ23_9ACTN|nr:MULTISPECIES: pitrilysin family protein [Nocardiopsis]QUX23167.1 insulinase family protein [Nocardiopsis changdeensis]QYX39110.1 insulinase family protein [Nocardiopsis sp. MT53]
MTTATAPPRTLHRTLSNGLRVRVLPLRSVSAVGIALHFGTGFRSDPPEFPGLAHLVEHLLFQGDGAAGHFTGIEALGGFCNASTRQDYTDYYTVVPSDHAEEMLALEARRVREPELTEAGLRTQIRVIEEEIGAKGRKPYGRFPWPALSPVLFRSYANAHDGFGDPAALSRATLEDCRGFLEEYCTASNAVLTVSGDIDPLRALDLAEAHFGTLPARPAPPRPHHWEPEPEGTVTGTAHDPLAARPGFALGYRTPDAAVDPAAHFGLALVAELLAGGPGALVPRRLAEVTGQALGVSARDGLFDLLDARDPDMWVLSAVHPADVERDVILDAVRGQVGRLAEHGPTDTELARARARRLAAFHRRTDQLAARTRAVGRGELLFGDGDLPATVHRGFTEATAEDVAAAARLLTREHRALLVLSPGEGGEH